MKTRFRELWSPARGALVALLGSFLCFAVAAAPAQAAHRKADEAEYFDAAASGYRMIGNARFNFWVDLPKAWRAYDEATNGDGFTIDTGRRDVDLRAWGGWVEVDSAPEGAARAFRFRDGKMGERISAPDGTYYRRKEEDRVLTVFVKAPAAWLEAHAAAVRHLAESLRPGK